MEDSIIQDQFDGHTESLKELRDETYKLRQALRYLTQQLNLPGLLDEVDNKLQHD